MEAAIVRDSFWLEGIISSINSRIGYLPAYFRINSALENFKKAETTAADTPVKNQEPEKQDDPCTSVIDHVWNPSTMTFDKTKSEDDFIFDNEDPIKGAVPYQGNAFGLNFELNDDQLDNFIDDSMRDLKPVDDEESRLFKYTILTVLATTNKISAKQCTDRCNSNEDNLILCNSIFRYFNNFPWFNMTTVDISEYMTKKQILKVMSYLNSKSMFDVDYAFAGMLRQAQDDYAKEERRRMSNNGEKEISDDEIITPIIFNNAFLGSADLLSGKVPAPQLTPGVKKTLQSKIAKILGIDLSDKKQELTVTVEGRVDPDSPVSCSDIGQALVSIKNKKTGFIYKQVAIDLDNITATGLNICGKAIGTNGQIVTVYVNLDKDVEIARKILINNGEYIINCMTDEGKKEYEKLNSKLLPDTRVYCLYDFSGMHKNLEKMTNKQKKRFTNRLMEIAGLPWYNLGIMSMGAPFRFRFRDFKSYNDITLVSDKEVRVQEKTWMAKPLNNPDGKLYMKKGGNRTDDKLIVAVQDNNFTVTLNGQDINWQEEQ